MKARDLSSCVVFLLSMLSSSLTAQHWQWTRDDRALNPSGVDLSKAVSWAWGDVDQDSRADILVRERPELGKGRLRAYRGQESFTPPYWVETPELLAGLEEPDYSSGISLADLDGDGTLNLITRVYDASHWWMLYWRKEGIEKWMADSTVFASVKFDGLWDHHDPFFIDVDADDDLDMLVSVPSPGFGVPGVRFFENVGTRQQSIWQEDSSKLALVYQTPVGYETHSATLMHVDTDSVLDLVLSFVIEGYSDVAFFPGVKDSLGWRWGREVKYFNLNSNGGSMMKLLPFDIENNGQPALIVLEHGTGRIYLKSGASDSFFDERYFRVGPIQFHSISSAIPFDYGNDRELDLLAIGHFSGFFGYATSLQAHQQYSLTGMRLWRNTQWFGRPPGAADVFDFKAQLADLDRNGLLDFVMSAIPYYFFAVFENPDANFQKDWAPRPDLMMPFLPGPTRRDTVYFDPCFADLDGDSDLDLLIAEMYFSGTDSGKARYSVFENQLSTEVVSWKRRDDWRSVLGEITYTHGYHAELRGNFVDVDKDGDVDLAFGTSEGGLLFYENIGGAISPAWQLRSEVFAGIEAGEYASPSFGDFDNDGRVDLFIGNQTGEVIYFRNETLVGVEEKATEAPRFLQLFQNHPNPFNPTTTIQFTLPCPGFVTLKVYNTLGQEVATLVNEKLSSKTYEVEWNASNMPNGVYLYRLQAGEFVETKKLTVLR